MFKKVIVLSAFVVLGCSDIDGDVDTLTSEGEINEIVDNLVDAGYPEAEIEILDDGRVMVGGDAYVTLEASREMAPQDGHGEDQFRQYRTNNLVDTSVVHTVCIDGSAYTGTMGQGLTNAIANYNNQNLEFTIERRGKNDSQGCDALIVGSVKGQAGGMSGFPSGGLPYGQFQVGKGTANYGVGVVTHVITHELGHTIGFRHSDYYNRSISCGGGASNEGDGGVGAQLIPGTPSTAVNNGSVMNSCFNQGSTGQWTNSDITALKALY